MINTEWVTHRSGRHDLYSVDVGIEDAAGNSLVTGYAVRRPDRQWALMLINRDRDQAHPVRIAFESGGRSAHFSGPVRMVTFDSEQYVWHGAGRGRSRRSKPAAGGFIIDASAHTVFRLPKVSVTVLRGEVGDLDA